ncbi:unnamed protein product, partial [Meganyctiphanes norvegica]
KLLEACDLKDVTACIEAGADVNYLNGITSLYVASQQNRPDIVQFLLDNNADVNKTNNEGETPLWVACYNNHRDINVVQLLLANNADVNKACNSGQTPLQWANSEAVQLLLDNNANINQADNKG